MSIVSCALGVAAAWPMAAQADSIRVDDTWYQDVYIVVTRDFFHILDPEDGTTKAVSKKRQNVSEPKFMKDEAERQAMRARWEEANKAREKADERDIELRVRDTKLSNAGEVDQTPKAKLSPQERAARQAAWQQYVEERRQYHEARQQYLDEQAGILPPDPTAVEPQPAEAQPGVTPPGPREAPLPAEPMTAEEAAQIEQMQSQPYFGSAEEQFYYEQAMRNDQERALAEQLYWAEMEAQGYLNSLGYSAVPPTDPQQSPTSQSAETQR